MGEFGCIQVRTFVARRVKKILAIYFLGSEFLARRFIRPFDDNGQRARSDEIS